VVRRLARGDRSDPGDNCGNIKFEEWQNVEGERGPEAENGGEKTGATKTTRLV
jgi:hypothetical protein